jgi:F-type H+-transporting ATPase subunit b
VTTLLALMLSAEEAANAAEHAVESSGGLPQMDVSTFPSQVFWLVVTFGALYWIMSAIILPRLGGAIEERRDRIADDLDQAAESRRMAEEAEAAYNRALADARAKAQTIAGETRDAVNAEIASLQADAEKSFATKAAAAENRIVEMKSQAAEKVRDAARDTSRAIIEVLIQETPTDAVVDSAIAAATKR